MNKIYFISDLHLGHKKILDFSPGRGGTTTEEHDEWIIESWNSVVTKRDVVWVLGDVAMGEESLKQVAKLRGQKNLIRGNHDRQALPTYLKYFNNVYGLVKRYGFWMSHCPLHPQELRGKVSVHGHTHQNIILDSTGQPDPRYISVCVEALNGIPITLEKLQEMVAEPNRTALKGIV